MGSVPSHIRVLPMRGSFRGSEIGLRMDIVRFLGRIIRLVDEAFMQKGKKTEIYEVLSHDFFSIRGGCYKNI